MNTPFLFVALDDLAYKEDETFEAAQRLVDEAGEFGEFGFKVNIDYLLRYGVQSAVGKIATLGRPIFADLKMWNGVRTMAVVLEDLVAAGVAYITVYALAEELLSKVIQVTEGTETKILGVTVLTHFDDNYCRRHFLRSLKETVRHLAVIAVESGCHGIVLPGTALRSVQGLETIKVVPGVRPLWVKDTRHQEEIGPRLAVRGGAHVLVCGSPIMKSDDPVAALTAILFEIR